MSRRVILLFLLLSLALNYVAWFWVLDFAIWYDHTYIYIPFVAWGVRLSKGDAVNICYWVLSITFVLSMITSYLLGRRVSNES